METKDNLDTNSKEQSKRFAENFALRNQMDIVYSDLKKQNNNMQTQNTFIEFLLVLLIIAVGFNGYVLFKALPLINSVLEKQQTIERIIDYELTYEE